MATYGHEGGGWMNDDQRGQRLFETPDPASRPEQPDIDTIADIATVQLLAALQDGVDGKPAVEIKNYLTARQLVKLAFVTALGQSIR